jgi:hypothetical protein
MAENIAVFIASHISNPRRIPFLVECISSLLQQTCIPKIYLSLSFETPVLQDSFLSTPSSSQIHLLLQPQKTSQMRHFQQLMKAILNIPNPPEWILFCDDDDTYAPTRVAEFAAAFETSPNIAGAYESTFGKTHQEHRHEYWCYGIHRDVFQYFFENISDPTILEHSCCDIILAEYLRRTRFSFIQIICSPPLYNYRRIDNDDSITGCIVDKQQNEIRQPNTPALDDSKLVDYIISLNDYLRENLKFYLHDTFLKTVIGADFDTILKTEFLTDYSLLDYIDQSHITLLKADWEKLRNICNRLYPIPLDLSHS